VSLLRQGIADARKVEVKDWGVGFDPAIIPEKHVGLEGIRLRAKLAGESAHIGGASGRGTTVLVELPLATPDTVSH
jgi:two-component system sensor histidine kinase DegS